ncbi:MAG: flagellar basal body P-ring formation chaperone FlgA, partial [Phycisphaerae bacterium]|nr:flagellar basal body P-ring formation chaperone FlgA [Phycisphaerae bacterium]
AAVLTAAVVLLTAAPAASGDSIELPQQVVVAPGAVRLADLAKLSGDYARGLADITVIEAGADQDAVAVSLEQVRAALEEHGVNWGRVVLRGRLKMQVRIDASVAVRSEPVDPASAGLASDEIGVRSNPKAPVAIDEVGGTGSVKEEATARQVITDWLRQRIISEGLAVEPLEWEVRFADADDSALALSADDYRFELEPMSRDALGRVPLMLRVYDDRRLVTSRRLRVDVKVRRPVVVARSGLTRGRILSPSDLKLEPRWLSSALDPPVEQMADAVGRQLVASVTADGLIRQDHVRSADLVRRGQLVTVRCLSGGLVIKTVARAIEAGGSGEKIRVRNERTREDFMVRVSGPQEAVLMLEASGQPAASKQEG